MVPCHRHPAFASSQLRLTIEVKHSGKSMVPCHRSPLRCMFCNLAAWSGTLESRWLLSPAFSRCISFTRPDRCGQAHREVDGSMPSAPTSLHVLQLGLTAWSGTSERRWFHAIDIHTVACSATRPSWSGTSESRWSHASASTPLHVLQLGLTIVGRHIGKSMVPCHRHAHRCMSCNSA